MKLITIHDDAARNDRPGDLAPIARRTLLPSTSHRTRPDRHRHRRRLSRRRPSRAPRSRRQDRHRRRAAASASVGALFAAIDGAQRLWGDKGFWRSPRCRRAVSAGVRRCASSSGRVALAVAIVAVPLAAMAVGARGVSDRFRRCKMVGLGGAGGLDRRAYLRLTQAAFAPTALPTWLPRLVVLVLGAAALVAVDRRAAARQARGVSAGRSGGGSSARRCRRREAVGAQLAVVVGPAARRGAAQAAGAGGSRAALHGAARGEHRPAGISRAARRGARPRCAPRSRVRAGGRAAAPRSGPAGETDGRGGAARRGVRSRGRRRATTWPTPWPARSPCRSPPTRTR